MTIEDVSDGEQEGRMIEKGAVRWRRTRAERPRSASFD